MLLEEKLKICKVSEFLNFPYTQNRKLGNPRKCSLTSTFGSCCNLIFRNNKNELRQKLCPVPKIEKWEILESFLSLQIFTVVVTWSKFVFSEERGKPCFFVTFNTKSCLFWKFHWSFSSCSEDMEIFSLNINTSIFRVFWHFLVTMKLMTSACYRWCRHFFTFNLL